MSSAPAANPKTARPAAKAKPVRPAAKAKAKAAEPPTPEPSARARDAARMFKMVADPTRLRALIMLAGREQNVGQMCAEIGVSQPALSHHLALLRASRMVVSRRDGKCVYYSPTLAGRTLAEAAVRVGG